MYFVVSEQNEPLRELDFIALENIIITLQFSLIRHVLEENLEKTTSKRFGISYAEWFAVK